MNKNINIEKILELHQLWLKGDEHGERANLSYVDLGFTNLRRADLRRANLRRANLSFADLSYADLRGAELRRANLSFANLSFADLSFADISFADISFADLRNANLSYANIHNISYNETTSFFALSCPEEGSFIGYKRAKNCIIKLLITEDARRSSATSRKCRCSKAKVLDITDFKTNEKYSEIRSNYDDEFIYKVGEIVEIDDFNENRWSECSNGIHFFITKEEAVNYN